MLELKKSEESKAESFRGHVKNLLGESAAVHVPKHETTMQCKDQDEVPSKAEICTACSGALQAILAEAARKLLDVGKVSIGWRVCRLRGQIALKKSFKCLSCGHLARVCTSEVADVVVKQITLLGIVIRIPNACCVMKRRA